MLYPRIIPCLLVHKKGLVKTVKFKDPKYVGDPLNAVKIFNEKEVDELMVFDIDATVERKEPDYKMIEKLAMECRMPLCYGGGIRTPKQAQRILNLGVEKIAMSSAVIETPFIVKEMADQVGAQSVVAVLDVRRNMLGKYDIYSENGTKKSKEKIDSIITKIQGYGVGEIVINSIDKDGAMEGYDHILIEKTKKMVSVPLTALGGAGSLGNIGNLIERFGLIGAAAGSLFVFKGRYRAVLINYPNPSEKMKIISEHYREKTS